MQVQLFSPVDLPCGRRVQNRLVKVAMYEHLAALLGGPPNQLHYSLYSKWSESDWGMIITGNVQVSHTHLGLGRDVVIPHHLTDESLKPFKQWADVIHGAGPSKGVLALMQLCHAGRQSTNVLGGRPPFHPPLAPSAIGVKPKNLGWLSDVLHSLAFQTPRPMSISDIDDVVEEFVRAARVAHMSGFDGVQIHAAHGYLVAQFISPKTNKRTDEYSSHPDHALCLLHRIVSAIRDAVPTTFIVAIKMNAADYVSSEKDISGTEDEDRVLNHVRRIASWGTVDFIEVSGGDYETPDFSNTGSPRQALFSRFSREAVDTLGSLEQTTQHPLPLVLLTGGLKTPELLHTALSANHAHLLGIGRGSVLCPDLPTLLKSIHPPTFDSTSPDPAWSTPFRPEPDLSTRVWLRRYLPAIPLVGASINISWYTIMIRRLATLPSGVGLEPDYNIGAMGALFWLWVWVDDSVWWTLGLVGLSGALAVLSRLV